MGITWCCPNWYAERKRASQGTARSSAVGAIDTAIEALQAKLDAANVGADTAHKEIARLLKEGRSEQDSEVRRHAMKRAVQLKIRQVLSTAIQGLETRKGQVNTHEIGQMLASTLSSVDVELGNLLSVSDGPQDLAKVARQSQKASSRLEHTGEMGLEAVAQALSASDHDVDEEVAKIRQEVLPPYNMTSKTQLTQTTTHFVSPYESALAFDQQVNSRPTPTASSATLMPSSTTASLFVRDLRRLN
jgi:hypothetical protein